jgi:glutamine amidotransferase
MQIMAVKGYEGGETKGLGWINGEVKLLVSTDPQERIPHIGWNEVILKRKSHLFEGILSGKDFYFVHSYHLLPDDEQHIIGWTPYCGGFVSAVGRDNIFGVQFHPEKSQRLGFQVIRNFLRFQG